MTYRAVKLAHNVGHRRNYTNAIRCNFEAMNNLATQMDFFSIPHQCRKGDIRAHRPNVPHMKPDLESPGTVVMLRVPIETGGSFLDLYLRSNGLVKPSEAMRSWD
jgi:hypothetical protein